MNRFDAVAAKGTVSHVTQKQFTEIRNTLFLQIDVLGELRIFSKFIIDSRVDLAKNVLNRLCRVGPYATDVALSWSHVEFNARQASTVLTSIVLLLHHEVHLVDPVKRRPVFFLVKAQGLF